MTSHFDHDDLERRFANADRWEKWTDAVDEYERVGKGPGLRNGPIGAYGCMLARKLAEQCNDDAVETTVDELAADLACSRGAVVLGLRSLVDHGFIEYRPAARGRKGVCRPIYRPRR